MLYLFTITQCLTADGSGAFFTVGTYYGTVVGCIAELTEQQLEVLVPTKATYYLTGVLTTVLPS